MSRMKKFEGKNIDEAIALACSFFAVEREQLEVEIIRAPSAGIFGLGTKKAVVEAKKRSQNVTEKSLLPRQEEKVPDPEKEDLCPVEDDLEEMTEEETDEEIQNPEELEALLKETITTLLKPITENHELTIDMSTRPITLKIEDNENSGLIIGREGQTIAAFQYILNRIIACKCSYNTRVQLDTGDYRLKQYEKLKDLALSLAEKSVASGRVYSTRPLSSYHRRVVHMTLQENKAIITRSKGDGPMKRVLILPKKEKKGEREARAE